MKKVLAFVLIGCMLAMCSAEMAYPEDAVFEAAKQSVSLLAEGKFDGAAALLKLPLSVAELKAYVDSNLPQIYTADVQTDISVAWLSGGIWYIAVPIEIPNDSTVPAVVYTLTGTAGFAGIEVAVWRDAEQRSRQGECVKWNVEYTPGMKFFVD